LTRFQYKEFNWLFLGLIIISALFLFLLQWKKNVKRRMGDEKLVNRLLANYSPGLFLLKFILIASAFGLGVLAVMNPRYPAGGDTTQRKGIDVAIALDVSKSMLATDLAPSRLERAKQFISKLMNTMPDDRVALILFAGKAYMQMPLTVDHGAAQLFVSAAGPDAIPQQGTVISDAMEMSAKVFDSKEKRFKTIVLISDGEDHDQNADRTAAGLAEQGVMINTIGIGSAEGSTIPDPLTGDNKKDAAGNTIISKLNEQVLETIARKTNGVYIHLQNTDEAVSQLQRQLSQIDRKAFGDVSMMNFRNFFGWLSAGMLLLLVADNFIPEQRRRKKNKA
jgi:Ca-activated chloride channel family protein